MTLRRRDLLASAGGALLTSILLPLRAAAAVPRLRITGIELRPVRATSRTVWLFVRLMTDAGLVGLGEASDAFGFANTTSADAARMRGELDRFFALVEGRSPLDIESYRQRGEPLARQGLVPATAFSAIEQAMWDLSGKALDVPTYVLLSGFGSLIRRHAVDTIMPDVKHCGGLLEMTRIAAVAADEGVMVAPHNPSGPISTAASVQVCAGMKNVNYLELQYGEVGWRSDALIPAERFLKGTIEIPDRPGFGVALNEDVIRAQSLPL
jgi:L-alanine-DL-glutamate epimerase-like enolase superfamily enzyme